MASTTTKTVVNPSKPILLNSLPVTTLTQVNTTTSSTPSSSSGATPTSLNCTSNNSLNNQAILISNNNNTNNASLLDLIRCKLSVPFHVVNDPRLLECGSSACFQCIMSNKNGQNNQLKCPYCKGVHTIPVDVNKLIVNKNLEGFLRNNNESMLGLGMEQRVQTQSMSMENFDQYLTLVQNDVQMKVETMKTHLEKYSEQFIENLKLIRKEVQKQWIDHTSTIQPNVTTPSNNPPPIQLTSNHIQQHLHTQHQHILLQQQKTFQLIGSIKQEPVNNSNPNVMTVLNGDQFISQMNSFHITNGGEVVQNENNNSLVNQGKTNIMQPTDIILNGSIDAIQNQFNFNNSASWTNNNPEDDLTDFETELSTTLKPIIISTPLLQNGSGRGILAKRQLNKEQAQFNKYVREEVSKKFGEDFLLQHEVNQLESGVMDMIKTEAISTFLPKDTTPARAWTLAKVSLRSLKRDLRRKQGMSSLKKESAEVKISNHPYYDVQKNFLKLH